MTDSFCFNSTCALLVLERAPDPELDDEGNRVAGKGEAARESGDEWSAAHGFVSRDASSSAHGIDVLDGPLTLHQFPVKLKPQVNGCLYLPTLA